MLTEERKDLRRTELIDTQWDVNTESTTEEAEAYPELIDTQWDVNINMTGAATGTARINRYIVGCK